MIKNIIVEGTDGTGKTTISKYIKGRHDFNYYHSSGDTPNDYNYHFELLDSDDKTVLDRFQIGEIIYPILFGRQSKLTLNQVLMLARAEDTHTIILYSSDPDYLFDRLMNRGDDIHDQDYINHVFQANKLFKLIGDFLNILEIPVTLVDVSQENVFGKVDKIIEIGSR